MTGQSSWRLDRLLVDRGMFTSRNRAQEAITSGIVFVNGRLVDRPGRLVPENAAVDIRGRVNPYVGRGGLKLEHALDAFGVDVTGKRCLDVGSSTGGFTDCFLSRGASAVVAVDVGHGQLDPSLRTDPRVTVLEGTDIRGLLPEAVDGPFSVAAVDVSFISLGKVLGPVAGHMLPGADVVALIKPQFEAGPGVVGKNGVVRDPAVVQRAIDGVRDSVRELYDVGAVVESPVVGGEGNREFFIHLVKHDRGGASCEHPDLA